MSKIAKILVFDSGVGGLSILREIQQQVGGCELFYACDNAAFPYGTKDEATLVERVDQVLKRLDDEIQPELIVVACNTASTVALPKIRSHFTHPVVGVVPAIKPAAELSKSNVIGLLATPGTVNRLYTQQLINDFAQHCEVTRIGSSTLVEMAEQKLRGQPVDQPQLAKIIAPFFEHQGLDTIVLACTHFPLLHDELIEAAPYPVQWIDSGEAIARRVNAILDLAPRDAQRPPQLVSCFYTATDPQLDQTFNQFGSAANICLNI